MLVEKIACRWSSSTPGPALASSAVYSRVLLVTIYGIFELIHFIFSIIYTYPQSVFAHLPFQSILQTGALTTRLFRYILNITMRAMDTQIRFKIEDSVFFLFSVNEVSSTIPINVRTKPDSGDDTIENMLKFWKHMNVYHVSCVI